MQSGLIKSSGCCFNSTKSSHGPIDLSSCFLGAWPTAAAPHVLSASLVNADIHIFAVSETRVGYSVKTCQRKAAFEFKKRKP